MDPAPGNWHTGKFNELMEAYRRAIEQGHDVSVGGNAAATGGKPAGKADVGRAITFTRWARRVRDASSATCPREPTW